MFGNDCTARHAKKVGDVWVQGEQDEYREVVQGNGVRQIRVSCRQCTAKLGFLPLQTWRRWVAAGAVLTLPAVEHTPTQYEPCSYSGCEQIPTEYHHFAPYNTFGNDASNWPCLPLCREHHRQWHQTMDGYAWHRRGIWREASA